MQKIKRVNTNNQNCHQNPIRNKSPFRRNTYYADISPTKSPIRCRTPTRNVSPSRMQISNGNPNTNTIHYITNISPLKTKNSYTNYNMQLSNGRQMKYINQTQKERFNTLNKNKGLETNLNSDRKMKDGNQLFGKIVNKLNSEKKNNLVKNREAPCQTTPFIESSGQKSGKKIGMLDSRFKQIISKKEKSQDKIKKLPSEYYQQEDEGEVLSCMVYKMKRQPNIEEQKHTKNPRQLFGANLIDSTPKQSEPEQSLSDITLILAKISQKENDQIHTNTDQMVKMSFANSSLNLSMKAFL